MNNKPVAWMYQIHDITGWTWVFSQLLPDYEYRNEKPLYIQPVKENYMDEVLNNTLNIEKNHNEKAYKELYEVCVKQQAEIEALKAHPADLTDEEIWDCHDKTNTNNWVIDFARAILRKAQEK